MELSGSANRKETITKIKTTFGGAASLNKAADCNLSYTICSAISDSVCPHCA